MAYIFWLMRMFLTQGTLAIIHGIMLLGWAIAGTICANYNTGEWTVFCFSTLVAQAFFGSMLIGFTETRHIQRWVEHLERTWNSKPIKKKPSVDEILRSGTDIENRL